MSELLALLSGRIRVVLVETSLPANIGAAARAMKTMGLAELVLVQPRAFPHPEALALASGADDLLAGARVVDDLDAALAGCPSAFGLAAARRGVALPTFDARSGATAVLAAAQAAPAALVFGTERTGLTNVQLDRCSAQITIASDPAFPSLNLAQAVQVMAHELRMAALAGTATPVAHHPAELPKLERFLEHLERLLRLIDFVGTRSPAQLMRRLRRLCHRAAPSAHELSILRGILSECERSIGAALAGSRAVAERYARLGIAARLPRALRRRDPQASSAQPQADDATG